MSKINTVLCRMCGKRGAGCALWTGENNGYKNLLVEDDTMLNEALPMLSEKRNIWYTAQKILRKRQAI